MPRSVRLDRMICIFAASLLLYTRSVAQTDADAITIPKDYFCAGAMFSHGSWKDYWEGNFKRSNLNLGRVSSNMYTVVGVYGISNKLNFLFSLPYVDTKASGGTLKGMRGIQDLSFNLKWKAVRGVVGNSKISVFAIGGLAIPASNYVADFQPLSIGMHSKNLSLRGMADYQYKHCFITASAIYTRRSNVSIDRTAYYDSEMHYTDEVKMPDMAGFNIRTGLRNPEWIAEAILENSRTLGGFDIRKNDMPFPSNRMNFTRVGANIKYSSQQIKGLELTAGGSHVVSGRNMGQSTMFNGGAFYLLNLSKKTKIDSTL